VTGFRLKPVTVRFRDGHLSSEYYHLVVVGWAGIARSESGIRLIESCPHCLNKQYSPLVDGTKLIDWDQWTGEDFFMVWPLPNYTLITPRVAELLEKKHVKSYTLQHPVRDDWGERRFAVGRLSAHLPDDLARKYGEPLGLEAGTPSWIKLSEVIKRRTKK